MKIVAGSLEVIHKTTVERLLLAPQFKPSPRGTLVHEVLGATLVLSNPRDRLILSPARAVNYGFGVGELCWYLRGDSDLETLMYYNRRASSFSDDGETVNSAYGKILFGDMWARGVSQWDIVKHELAVDTDSRRAVMHINLPQHMYMTTRAGGTKDVPCTMSLQFMIRDRLLHLHVLMRSNDVAWGLPYDVFSFTVMQELMLRELQALDVPVDDLGTYVHTCGSLHLYDYHFDMARSIVDEEIPAARPMKPLQLQEMEYLAEDLEPQIRMNWRDRDYARGYFERTESSDDSSLDWMIHRLVQHREKRLKQAGDV